MPSKYFSFCSNDLEVDIKVIFIDSELKENIKKCLYCTLSVCIVRNSLTFFKNKFLIKLKGRLGKIQMFFDII